MKKLYFRLLGIILVMALGLSVSSCFDDDDALKLMASDDVELDQKDEKLFTVEGNNLLVMSVNYPYLSVRSIFSNVERKPTITYIGECGSIDDIPVHNNRWDNYDFGGDAEIHDNGGYVIRMTTYNAYTKASREWLIAMVVREREGVDGPYIRVAYRIYAED